MSQRLHVDISPVAADQVRTAENWWRVNRTKAPSAIREELQRASSLIAMHPQIGMRARKVTLVGVRRLRLARIRYDLYYRLVATPPHIEILAFWHASRGSGPPT